MVLCFAHNVVFLSSMCVFGIVNRGRGKVSERRPRRWRDGRDRRQHVLLAVQSYCAKEKIFYDSYTAKISSSFPVVAPSYTGSVLHCTLQSHIASFTSPSSSHPTCTDSHCTCTASTEGCMPLLLASCTKWCLVYKITIHTLQHAKNSPIVSSSTSLIFLITKTSVILLPLLYLPSLSFP